MVRDSLRPVTCPQFDFCELRKVAEFVGIKEDIRRYVPSHLYCEEDKPLFIRDYNLCIGCLRVILAVGQKADLTYLHQELEIEISDDQTLGVNPDAKYFSYEEDPMYTKRESELIQQFLQTHGHLPPGNEDVDDLF